MSHLQLSRGRPRNSLNQPAPIESALPAEIRDVIYELLAPIDQFKVNLCKALRRVFNPYEIYSLDADRKDFSMLLYMYAECQMYDKVFPIMYNYYKNSPQSLVGKIRGFNVYNDLEYRENNLHNYYSFMDRIIGRLNFSANEMCYNTCIVFIKFCLIKLDKDRRERVDSKVIGQIIGMGTRDNFWNNYYPKGYGYDDTLTAELLYYSIYRVLIWQINNRNIPELYDILDKYYINTDIEFVANMLRITTNGIEHDYYELSLLIEQNCYKLEPAAIKLRYMLLKYVENIEGLLNLFMATIINKEEFNNQILLLIDKGKLNVNELLTNIRDYYCSRIDTSFIFQNTVIANYLQLHSTQLYLDVLSKVNNLILYDCDKE